jgi:hypothetical protein
MRIDNALAQISKHKHLIIVVIGVTAIASYMIPFANLFSVADATSGGWWEWKQKQKKVDFKKDFKKKFDFKFAKFFQKLFFKNLFIDNSETTTNIFKNFGVKQNFNFQDINTATAYTGGLTTTPTSGSAVALNAGTTFIFVNNVLNCPSAAGSGSDSVSISSTKCVQNNNIQIQSNPYVTFGGSV